jgi:CrcB protein
MQSTTYNFLLVFLGGGLGASARYWMYGAIMRSINSTFPYGTMAVNILGCFLIGLLMTAFEERFLVQPTWRIFLTVGILGGFTTFSTFSFETIALLRDAQYFSAAMNVCGSVGFCLIGTFAGTIAGKAI